MVSLQHIDLVNDLNFNIVTYNLHGLNQGRAMLDYLCTLESLDIIFIQEHWLSPFNMNNILQFSDNFTTFGSSALDAAVSKSVLRGRPYGGTATLVNKKYNAVVKCCRCSEYFVMILINKVVLINVYFPCRPNIDDNLAILAEIFTDINCCLDSIDYDYILFGGDMNVNLKAKSKTASVISHYLQEINVVCTVDLNLKKNGSVIEYTYHHESLGEKSYLDYIFISDKLLPNFIKIKAIDDVPNYSDHTPVLLQLKNKINGVSLVIIG